MQRLTRTCHMFSAAPSKEQNRMETPSSPWPPHVLVGTSSTSEPYIVHNRDSHTSKPAQLYSHTSIGDIVILSHTARCACRRDDHTATTCCVV